MGTIVNAYFARQAPVAGADAYQLEDGTGNYLAENGDTLILE